MIITKLKTEISPDEDMEQINVSLYNNIKHKLFDLCAMLLAADTVRI